jgi:hypothetical protein
MLRLQGIGKRQGFAVTGGGRTAFAGDFWNKIGARRTFYHG